MKPSNTIFKNTGAVLFGTLIRMSSSFLLTILVARTLGSKGMGEFSLLLSLFYVFGTMASLGLQPLIIREVAKDRSKANAFLVNTGLLGILASIVLIACLIGFTRIAGYAPTIRVSSYFIGGALVFTTLSTLFQGLFIAYERAEYILYTTVAESIFKLGAGLVVLSKGHGIVALSIVIAFSSLIGLLLNGLMKSLFFEKIRFVLDWTLCRAICRLAPTFAGISVFNALLSHAVLIILSILVEMEVVGYYGAAIRLVSVFRLVLQSYKSAIQPVSARLVQRSMEKVSSFCHNSIRYILVLILPICVGTAILSNRIVTLFYTEQFIEAGPVLRLAIWVLIPYGIGMVFSNILIAADHQSVNLRVNAVSLVVRVALALSLIPLFGPIGAAVSILASRIVFLMIQIIFIQNHLFRLTISPDMWKNLVASILMGICIILLYPWNLFLLIGLGIILFFVFLFITGGFRFSELRKFMLSNNQVSTEST